MGTGKAGSPRSARPLGEAVKAADAAVEGAVPAGTENPPSSTVVAVVIDAGLAVAGNVGDSRAYWLPDVGDPLQLSTDDSWAAEMIRAGRAAPTPSPGRGPTRSPGGSASTRPTISPRTAPTSTSTRPAGCWSAGDGLWNYCSEAMALRDLLASTLTGLGPAPVDLVAAAEALVTFSPTRRAARTISPLHSPVSTGQDRRTHQRRTRRMAEFTAEAFQNEFLPDGGPTSTRSSGSPPGTPRRGGRCDRDRVGWWRRRRGDHHRRHLRVDGRQRHTAGCMPPGPRSRRSSTGRGSRSSRATTSAVHVYPRSPVAAMVRMDARTRAEALAAIQLFRADGGTAMGTWLSAARAVFHRPAGRLAARHLADRRRERARDPEQLSAAIAAATGSSSATAGVGDRWQVGEVRRIASALLGTVDLIPAPEHMAAEFAAMMRASMARGIANADLRVWAPQGPRCSSSGRSRPPSRSSPPAAPRSTRSPAVTHRGLVGRVPRLPRRGAAAARSVGQEQLASRVQLVVGDQTVAQALVKATWSNDDALTTRIAPEVAAYTGRAELAAAIQDGLAAKAAGNDAEATSKLGRAVQLATQAGDDEMTSRLKKVVDIEGPRGRDRPAQEGRREARRDGPGHRLDEDLAGAAMSATCPNGHESAATDYCDTCGAPMVAPGSAGNGASVAGSAASAGAASGRPLGAASGAAPAASPDPGGASAAPASGAGASVCPHCGAPSAPDVLFARPAGTTSPPAPCPGRRPPRAHPPPRPVLRPVQGRESRPPYRWSGSQRCGSTPVVCRPGGGRPVPLAGAAGRRAAHRLLRADRPGLDQPQYPPGHRLRDRLGGEPPARP